VKRAEVALLLLLVGACKAASGNEEKGGSGAPQATAAQGSVLAPADAPPAPLAWPDLLPDELEPPFVSRARPIRVYLDAGHGAKDNSGNTSSFCVQEQEFTASLARDLKLDLEALGGFDVILSRPGTEVVPYAERVEGARRARADVFVSLHSDVRGKKYEEWSPDGSAICRRNVETPGFSVLYSDEGAPALVSSRKRLADSIADALLEARFEPYLGAEYVSLYEPIPSETGVFVDRHEPGKRILVLRRTEMPAVIVETHNALDPREAIAFEDPLVRARFGLALAKGIAVALQEGRAP
jgi:N-acetylmuramoyl-L-alanine amidase